MFNRSKYLDLLIDAINTPDGHIIMEKILNRLNEFGFKDDAVRRDTHELTITTGKKYLTNELINGSYIELFLVLHAMSDCGIDVEVTPGDGKIEELKEILATDDRYDIELIEDIISSGKIQNAIKVVSGMGKLIEHILKIHIKATVQSKDWREYDKIDKLDDSTALLQTALEKDIIDEYMYRRLIRIFNDRDRFNKTTRGTRREIPLCIIEEYINSQISIVIDFVKALPQNKDEV